MKIYPLIALASIITFSSCKEEPKTNPELIAENLRFYNEEKAFDTIKINPISHATMVLEYGLDVIYVDAVGGAEAFKNQKQPTIVLITDIHGDHLNVETLQALDLTEATLVVPQAVADKLPENIAKEVIVINNGETKIINGISVEAIPMYNLREEALKFHQKGRGNGYVLTFGDERVYISGDTEDILEMRQLKNIDKAFVCMNLPYTMTVESAADAVLEFQPKQVYPYHYRGTEGLSDVEKFKSIVNTGNADIDVVQLNWYE
uniref:MBL fold metallo-hydrolase n=1 Tax=Gelidibacter sp. TaxID=2018083 RepID=UPI0040497692